MIIDNASILLGSELTFVSQGFIIINNSGVIIKAGAGSYSKYGRIAGGKENDSDNRLINGEGFLVVPGLINAHTHIGDSIGKDVGVASGLDARVHPIFGIKRSILKNTRPQHLVSFMRNSAISMMKKGITAFADFREGGEDGVELLRYAVSDLPIKCVILGRVESYFGTKAKNSGIERVIKQKKAKVDNSLRLTLQQLENVRQVLLASDGLGLSGANENSDESLKQYHSLVKKKIIGKALKNDCCRFMLLSRRKLSGYRD